MKNKLTTALLLTLVMGTPPANAMASDIPYLRCFTLASQQHQIPLGLLIGVASVESGFDASARSPANAHGLMQIRWPLTAHHLGVRRVAELYNPCVNIDIGARYLRELMARYRNDVTLSLAAYNYGPTRLKSKRDIPAGVMLYVEKVLKAQPDRQADRQAGKTTGTLELVRFSREWQAEKYFDALSRLVPGLPIYLDQSKGSHRVLADSARLTYLDRVRLEQIMGADSIELSPDSITSKNLPVKKAREQI